MKVCLYKSSNKLIKKLVVLKLIKNNIFCNKKMIKFLKFLKIILKYYLKNKKILLLGTSQKISFFFKFINQFKNIAYIPNNIWLKGLLTNSFVFKALYFSKKKESFKLLLNFLPNYDIIISLNSRKNKELLKLIQQPILYFDQLHENLIINKKLSNNNFIYFLIYQILLKFKHVK